LWSWLADVEGDELCLIVSILKGGLSDEDSVWLLMLNRIEWHLNGFSNLV
jgi:hypothetical protein